MSASARASLRGGACPNQLVERIPHAMRVFHFGFIVALLYGSIVNFAVAQTVYVETRPYSRADAHIAHVISIHEERRSAQARVLEQMASKHPQIRPVYVVRYPVVIEMSEPDIRPKMRPLVIIPDARWDHRPGGEQWSIGAMAAMRSHGHRMIETVPRDIAHWCPGYVANPPELRRAFWVGMMSALSKHESTYNPRAVGGGGLWYGLLQILPDTARRYGCYATTGEALKSPTDNLSCAIRIMNVTVPRDAAVALRDNRWRGVAADWGPMRKQNKVNEMAAWTRRQSYCQPNLAVFTSVRPIARATQNTNAAPIQGATLIEQESL